MTEIAEAVFDRCVPALGECVNYTGWRNPKGYGRITFRGSGYATHRAAYESAKGSIPEGLVIDHLCRNPSCCNPNHLEAVTNRENTRRGLAGMHAKIAAQNQTHCLRGHERNAVNTRGKNQCHQCKMERQQELRVARRALALAAGDW